MNQQEQDVIYKRITDLGLEPYDTANSLHVYEEKYELDGVKYSFYYSIGGGKIPDIEVTPEPIDIGAILDAANSIRAKNVLSAKELKAFQELSNTVDSYKEGYGEKWGYEMKAVAIEHGETLRKTIKRLVNLIHKNK